MSKMRHIFGFSRNALRHFQNAREGVPDAPFSRNCARSGSTASVEDSRGRFLFVVFSDAAQDGTKNRDHATFFFTYYVHLFLTYFFLFSCWWKSN